MNLHNALSHRFGGSVNFYESPNSTLEKIAQRGSCRDFSEELLDENFVQTLCAVALSSPTKSDLQQRDIIILTQQGNREKINALFPNDPWIQTAPTFMVFCGNNRRQRQINEWRGIPFANDHLDAFFNASIDAGIALGTFVIAAESEGLGCCPISAIRNYSEEVSSILQLPQHVFPVAGLALGWPQNPAKVSLRLPIENTVHFDRYDDKDLEESISAYDERRHQIQPYAEQRHIKEFGIKDNYGWSEDKARQYSVPDRADFGEFIRRKGFKLD
jgi:nitroreductase